MQPLVDRTGARPVPATASPANRPRFLDYLLILGGFVLSALLGEMSGLRVASTDLPSSPWLIAWMRLFPLFLFLPLGIILLWPVFFTTQKIFGRPQGLTSGEWLLGLAWLGALAIAAWVVIKATGPEFLAGDEFKKYVVLGYVLFTLAAGAVALVLLLVGLVGRWSQPWTHTFALALLLWPALPMALLWGLGLKLE